MHLNVMFSNESDLKKCQDFLYQKSLEDVNFTGLFEAMCNEVTIVTAIHYIINVVNATGNKTDKAVWAVEGDIKGCFDTINHRMPILRCLSK